MSEPYEKPTVTYVGNLFDQVGAVQPDAPTYNVGDYVWATSSPTAGATRWLAHVESKHSVRSAVGRRWLVRVRRRSFWTSGASHMYIVARLTGEEFRLQRQLGMIPPAGESL